jgi:hypothetical protein
MDETIKEQPYTYLLVVMTIFLLMTLHLFGIIPLATDKFAFFLVSLVVVILLMPYLRYIKFFDLVELRKEVKSLKEEFAKQSNFSIKKR